MTKQKNHQRSDVPTAAEERSLPHNLDAERAVLGAILANNAALDRLGATLTPTHFYREAHRHIYTAMQALHGRRAPIDYITLKDELGRAGVLESVGGPAYIASLGDGVPKSTNSAHYAAIVTECALRREIVYAGNAVLAAAYDGTEDATTILRDADRRFLALHGRNGSGIHTLAETAHQRYATMEWRVEHKGELRGLGTGYPGIDALTLGLRAGDLDIVAARPSMGKTSLAVNIGVHAATQGHRVVVFSLEMTRDQLEDRIMAQLSQVALTRIQSGCIGGPEWDPIRQAINAMNTIPIVIDDRSGVTAVDIRAACRQVMADDGAIGLVVVDYIQLIGNALQRKGANRTEELSHAATRLKELAKELQLPVLLVSQLRRIDGRPRLDDLRECGTLEQVADVVGFLHRKDHRVGGPTEFIVAKQRNGATGSVMLSLTLDTTTFTESAEAVPEPAAEESQAPQRRARSRTFARRWAAGS